MGGWGGRETNCFQDQGEMQMEEMQEAQER